jgi:hypothetical protein
MSFQAGLGAVLGLPPISEATVLSGILSTLLDLDHVELPPHRTPAGHSIPSAAIVTFGAAVISMSLLPGLWAFAVIALFSAFWTHLWLDAMTEGGIFLWPQGLDPKEWLQALPDEVLVRFDGRYFLASDERDHQALEDGSLAWPLWRRARLAPPAWLHMGKPMGDVLICSLSLIGLLAAVAAT